MYLKGFLIYSQDILPGNKAGMYQVQDQRELGIFSVVFHRVVRWLWLYRIKYRKKTVNALCMASDKKAYLQWELLLY